MHPADIQAALKKQGLTQKEVAVRNNVSRTTVSHVIHGRGKSKRIALAIASATGLTPAVLWPGLYEFSTMAS